MTQDTAGADAARTTGTTRSRWRATSRLWAGRRLAVSRSEIPVRDDRPPRPPRRRSWFAASLWVWLRRLVVTAVAVSVVVVAVVAGQVWWVGRQDARPRSDVLIVLGASQYNGRPSAVFAARLDHADRLYKDGVAPHVITVGGAQVGDQYTEAEAGGNYLANHGVPRSALVEVGEGDDTLNSLRAVSRVMRGKGWHSAVVVTDPWHSLRSRRIARDLDIQAVTSPARSGPAVHGRETEVRYVLRETAGYVFYRLFHRASPPGGPAAV